MEVAWWGGGSNFYRKALCNDDSDMGHVEGVIVLFMGWGSGRRGGLGGFCQRHVPCASESISKLQAAALRVTI